MPSVGNIKTHITAQVKGLTNGDSGFRVTQDLYLSLAFQERKLIPSRKKDLRKVILVELELCAKDGFCAVVAGKVSGTWFLKPRSSQSREGDIHTHPSNPSQYRFLQLLQAHSPPPLYTHTSMSAHILLYITSVFLLCPSYKCKFLKNLRDNILDISCDRINNTTCPQNVYGNEWMNEWQWTKWKEQWKRAIVETLRTTDFPVFANNKDVISIHKTKCNGVSLIFICYLPLKNAMWFYLILAFMSNL